jgi:hypothetical protein
MKDVRASIETTTFAAFKEKCFAAWGERVGSAATPR